jgi:ribosomal protein L13
MSAKLLGKVENVELREIWPDEARDFTPWLSTQDGLELLGTTIGDELELVEREANVGPFSADLLLRIPGEEEHLVVVENQFGKTNHDHLGKLITYASGLQGKTMVWIAESFTDEHRQSLDWLNESQGAHARFFGLQVYAIKIGNSLPAPQFKVISSPNVWAQAVREAREKVEVTATKLDQQKFWEEVREFIKSNKSAMPTRQSRPQNWYDISIGRMNFVVRLTVNTQVERVGCELTLFGPRAKQAFDLLQKDQQAIEREIGTMLEWQRLDNRDASRIVLYKEGSIYNPTQRQELKEWLYKTAECFYRFFGPRVRALKLSEESEED